MIDVEHVSKSFSGNQAVIDISFRVEAGERLSLLGTSGCGKTTTLRMINRLTEPTQGVIRIEGKNVAEQQPENLRRSIGYVIQNHGLFPHYTVEENISLVPNLLRADKARTRNRCQELMEKLHLDPVKYMHVYPEQLSGGQQQRVGLARALAADPPLLLMDEPFGALDTVTRNAIRKDLLEMDEFKKKTIILVTHDVQEAFAMSNRICLMDKGRIMQIGRPGDLIFNPANDFVRQFLEAEKTQLMFKSIKMHQLFPLLPVESPSVGMPLTITDDSSAWSIMELFFENTGSAKEDVILKRAEDGRVIRITPTALIAAINHLNTFSNA